MCIGGAADCGVREGMKRLFWKNPDYNLTEIVVTKDGTLTRQQILDAAAYSRRA